MSQAKMMMGQVYDEEEGEWNVNVGDIIFWNDKLWIITGIGGTILHNHHYINILTHKRFLGKIRARIYSWEAKQIKSFYKVEKK